MSADTETLVYDSRFGSDMCDYHRVMMDTAADGQRAVYDCNRSPEEVGFEHLSDVAVNAITRQICTGWGIDVPEWADEDGLLYVDAADTPNEEELS